MTERQKQLLWRQRAKVIAKDIFINISTALSFLTLIYIYNQRFNEEPWTTFEIIAFIIAIIICSGFIIANFIDKRVH